MKINGRFVLSVIVIAVIFGPTGGHASTSSNDGSGGQAVAHLSGGRIVHGVEALQAPDAELYRTGHDAIEPTLGMTKSGTLFFVAASGNGVSGVRSDVLRSTDLGTTWEVVSPNLAGQGYHTLSLDPYIWIDEETNRVFTIDLTVACSLLSFSDDFGASWLTNPVACDRPVNDHQTIFGGDPVTSDPILYENVLYYCYSDFVVATSCGKSLDGGLTWRFGGPVFLSETITKGSTALCPLLVGHGVVGPDGTVYLPKHHCGKPWLAISHDEGSTWSHVQIADRSSAGHRSGGAADPSTAVDEDGNVYYAYVADDGLPYLSYSRDGGTTWNDPVMIAAPGLTEAAQVTIDVGAPGAIAAAYYGTDDVSGPLDQREYPDSVLWNGYITMSTDVFASEPVFYSGNVNDPSAPLTNSDCGPRRCDLGLDFIDVIVGSDGTPWASFTDSCVWICPLADRVGTGVVGRLVGGPDLNEPPSGVNGLPPWVPPADLGR